MKRKITYKFEAYPNEMQKTHLERQIYGLRRVYNAMIEYIYLDKILFRENLAEWIEQRMRDCYGKETARVNLEGRDNYRKRLSEGKWFAPSDAMLTNIATKIKTRIVNSDGSLFDSSYITASSIVSLVRIDFKTAIKGIRSSDQIYKENGQWYVERITKTGPIKFPLKAIKGFPSWKKKGDNSSYYEDVSGRDNITINGKNGYLIISKLDTPLRFYVHREMINGNITQKKTVTLDIDGRWWICIVVEYEAEEMTSPIEESSTVGIDLGMKTHAVASNGVELNNPANYQRLLKRKEKLSRIVSRKFEEKKKADALAGEKSLKSKNLIKAQRELAKIEVRIRNCRKKAIEGFASMIVKDDSVNTVVLENLSTSELIKSNKDSTKKYRSRRVRKFNRSLHNSALFATRVQFRNKCDQYGKNLIIAKKEFPSTQLCQCGAKTGPKGESNLSMREWTCSSCGKINNRDYNAAINLQRLPFAYESYVECAEVGVEAHRRFS
jgi:transposase